MNHPKFTIEKTKEGMFRWSLSAKNAQIILTGEKLSSKDSCKNSIESAKRNSTIQDRFERCIAKNGDPYFNLKAGNNQVIGTSEMYSGKNAMENGIDCVIRNAPIAEIFDATV